MFGCMYHVAKTIRRSWPLVIFVWFCLQFWLWCVLDKEHHGQSLILPTANNNNDAPGVLNSPTHNNENNNTFYIVFSTDCSSYQHWQGILLYYSARRVRQPGIIIRIASGCTLEQQQSIQDEWQRIDPAGDKFQVHFAPSTTLKQQKKDYKYSNKPGGILHWLQNYPRLDESAVVCLLDPDMILLKPITADLVKSQNHWRVQAHGKNQVEYIDERGVAQLLRVNSVQKAETSPLPARVTTGFPAGQHFGVGGAWVQAGGPHAKPTWRNFSKAMVCGEGAPCTATTKSDADNSYNVGPVYLATVADWKRLAATWWDFVPRVHPQYPHLLAEMYSFTMAAANLKMPFRLFSSYMVTGSGVTSPTEAWSWVDDILQKQQHTDQNKNRSIPQQICSGVDSATPPDWSRDPQSLALPNTLHYCQRYKLDAGENSFLFAKRKISHDVFSCAQEIQPEPFDVKRLIVEASKRESWSATDRRSLFALCHLVPILNWARNVYQEETCQNRSLTQPQQD